jgi:hypothetical protein
MRNFMKRFIWRFLLLVVIATPSLSYAKGVPMFFQTGDELFEIDGAPKFDNGYSVGYACQRFGLFGADIWTWDCDLMAININEFSAGELDSEDKAKMEAQYTLSDRVRNPWNHYGAVALALLLVGGIAVKTKN